MAEKTQPKAETKRPRKRNAAGAKGTKTSKAKASDVESPVTDVPAAGTPPPEEPPSESSAAEEPVAEAPKVVEPAVPDAPASADSSEEELRKARKLLKANGYLLVPYRKIGKGIVWFFCVGFVFLGSACKSLCGWIAKKYAAMKVWREERRRITAEKKRLDDETARRAEIARAEKRLAELRVEEARLKAAVASTVVPPAEEPARQPVAEPVGQPVAEKSQEAEAVAPVDSDVPRCAVCGAELAPGARFCRKCGEPTASRMPSP